MKFLESPEIYIPKKVRYINDMLINRFKAISIDKNDSRISHLMNDPHIPDLQEIYGIYCIYRKSILGILQNKYSSFDSYEFNQALLSDRSISNGDFEDVLDFSILVIIASKDNKHISNYYMGGTLERLNSILNVSLGFPQNTNPKYHKNTVSVFNEDIRIVEDMGYLDNIIKEKI
jgi:hypothetical protein